jgi:hypothetical protein
MTFQTIIEYLDIIILTVNNTDINEKHPYQNRLWNRYKYITCYAIILHCLLFPITLNLLITYRSLIEAALISLDYILLVEGGVDLYKH